MIRSYLVAAIRNILRHKSDSLINILGLTIGLAVVSFILILISDSSRREDFHANHDRIMRVVQIKKMSDNTDAHFAYTPERLPALLEEEIPEVLSAFRVLIPSQRVIHTGSEYSFEDGILAVDPEFLDIFSFKLLQGDPENCLNEINSIVLTESAAKKYFERENPVGKSLVMDNSTRMKITGVIEDPPASSHLQFAMLESFATEEARPSWQQVKKWHTPVITYLLLDDPASRELVDSRLLDIYFKCIPGEDNPELYLQPIDRIHLYSDHIDFDYVKVKSNINHVFLFASLALVVLLLACVNYVNLATARSMLRTREVGLRKVVGANRRQLIFQYLSESVILTLIAFPLAMLVVELVMPWFNEVTGRDAAPNILLQGWMFLSIFCITLLIGFIAGIYPAFVLSAFKPILIVSKQLNTPRSNATMRKLLVIGQFTVSITLVIASLIINRQMRYLLNHPLGFETENRLVMAYDESVDQVNIAEFREKLKNEPDVIGSTRAMILPGGESAFNHVYPTGYKGEKPLIVSMNIVDSDFIETMGIDLIEGRDFMEYPDGDIGSVVVNQAAMKFFGWDDISEKYLGEKDVKSMPVVGIVHDYHDVPLHHNIQPKILINYPSSRGVIIIHVRAENIKYTISAIKRIWSSANPTAPFEYKWLDEIINKWYQTEKQIEIIINIFAILSVFIAFLGLIGLTLFVTQRRTREIGIRRVLGANIPDLIRMLAAEFSILIVISCLIAWPIAYYIMDRWLQNFAFRVDIGISIFFLAGVAAFIAGIVMVGTISYRASVANPVQALRYE